MTPKQLPTVGKYFKNVCKDIIFSAVCDIHFIIIKATGSSYMQRTSGPDPSKQSFYSQMGNPNQPQYQSGYSNTVDSGLRGSRPDMTGMMRLPSSQNPQMSNQMHSNYQNHQVTWFSIFQFCN